MRTVLAISVKMGYHRKTLEVKNAFLNAKLEEEIYINQPDGFQIKGKEDCVYRLWRALYGLKQSSREWNRSVDKILQSLGFIQKRTRPNALFSGP